MNKILAEILLISLFTTIMVAQITSQDPFAPAKLPMSMVQLISTPERFHGIQVTVSGYIHIKFNDTTIYLSKVDADYLNGANACCVSFSDKVNLLAHIGTNTNLQDYDCKHVIITGIFHMRDKWHPDMFAGTIKSVNSIIEQQQYYDGKEKYRPDNMKGRIVPIK